MGSSKNFLKSVDNIESMMYNIECCLAELCNGSTTDSDSVCWGSNPYSAAKSKRYNL